MWAALLACALAGSAQKFLAALTAVCIGLPESGVGQTFGAWQFGKIDGVCAVASPSVARGDNRSFNIMVTDDDRIFLYVALDQEVPNGARHFAIQISGAPYWLLGTVDNGALLFDLSTHPESSGMLTDIIDGRTLTLIGGLGDEVARFSLNGSGRAMARLAACIEQGE